MPPRHIKPCRFSEASAEFRDWQRAVQGRSLGTQRASAYILNRVEKYLGNPMVYNIERNAINRYIADRGRVLSLESVNQEKTRLRTFLRWCEDERYLDPMKNVTRDLKQRKAVRVDRKRLTADQFTDLYESAICRRDRMLLVLLTDTLMRGSEAVQVRWGNVRFDDGEIDFIRWKTRQAATVPISRPLDQELRQYRVWYESKIGRPAAEDEHVICRTDVLRPGVVKTDENLVLVPSEPLSRVHEIVQRGLVACGFEGEQGVRSPLLKEGGHTLRRSAARELLEALFRDEGLNTDEALLMVMNMLGHASLDMTMRYIGYDRDREKVMKLLKGKDWWASARPADVIQLAPRPRAVSNG